ncbi:MAG: FIST C-terminal domain-containing protein [Oscillospiraceae bacterium]|nr:FIST C-terminal domain-containing protein [Oscillospiraceae bacterium]
MIKTLTAYTSELDDEKLAVEQIKSQLNIHSSLLKNTVGIVACHYEFILSDIFAAICKEMPFDVAGTISSAQAVPGEKGALLLTLMVLTSDEVEFKTVVTPSLLNEPSKTIIESYTAACEEKKSLKPSLILTFAPFILQNCGDDYVNALNEASGGAPCFGTLAVDDTLDFANCFALANGEHHRDKMTMVLIYGELTPKFFVANISETRIMSKAAKVTKSAGPLLIEVDERPVIDFLNDLGLVKAGGTQYAMSSLPFLLDYNDGTPKVSKIMAVLTPENHALCAGAMPENSTLYLTSTDKDDVMLTTAETVEDIYREAADGSALLVYSCINRGMTLGSERFKEMELLNEKFSGKLFFMAASAGGEICPTQLSDKKAINRFHNNAFVACMI